MLRWYPDILLRVVLTVTFLPIAFASIFAVNVVADGSTPWVVGGWSGPGATLDFLKVSAILLVGWAVFVCGWRGAKAPFHVAILGWRREPDRTPPYYRFDFPAAPTLPADPVLTMKLAMRAGDELVDFDVCITDHTGRESCAPLSTDSPLFPQIDSRTRRLALLEGLGSSEPILRRYALPLAGFSPAIDPLRSMTRVTSRLTDGAPFASVTVASAGRPAKSKK